MSRESGHFVFLGLSMTGNWRRYKGFFQTLQGKRVLLGEEDNLTSVVVLDSIIWSTKFPTVVVLLFHVNALPHKVS